MGESMKVKVFKKEDPKEREVELMLFEKETGVFLAVVDKYGNPKWYLLSVSPDGIRRNSGVPDDLGFAMSSDKLFFIS